LTDSFAGRASAPARPTAPATERTLAYGATAIGLRADDRAASDWLAEFLGPWFAPADGRASWSLTLSTAKDRHEAIAARRPSGAAPRACFALDQQVIALPAWRENDAIAVADAERSCFLVVEPFRIVMLADAATLRWRFTLQWVHHEIVATRLRRTALDLHAAAVEAAGDAILIVGPKGAGKTTLSFHLLRSGLCRWITNDRAFAEPSATRFEIRGIPTPVKILPPTLREFPELGRGLRPIERPYLHLLDEVVQAAGGESAAAAGDLALSPAQVAHQMRIATLPSAPLRAVLFPDIRDDVEEWTIERLEPAEVATRLWSNLYGQRAERREATIFEEIAGGHSAPQRALADAVSTAAKGYRVVLGRNAYADPDFAARLLERARR
jgi:hypothetical protein